MLAAVEVYNKTAFEYRAETFCLLIVNAWEIVLKARIVQQNNESVQAIYRRQGRRYERGQLTDDVLTINLRDALNKAGVSNTIRENIRGLYTLRNEVQHRGLVDAALDRDVLRFGTAAVRNMIVALNDWFGEPTDDIYLFPVGFVGVTPTVTATSAKQRRLLQRLDEIASTPSDAADGYHVAAEISVEIHASGSGGGTIGVTGDTNAPKVQVTEEQIKLLFPATYRSGLLPAARARYSNFKAGRKFNELMKAVKKDARCTHVRRLDPENPRSVRQEFYNPDAVFQHHLDGHYARR